MDINQLPDECLLSIFSYLNPLEIKVSVLGVCERWKNLGSDTHLKNDLFIHAHRTMKNRIKTKYFMKVLRECSTVKSITFDENSKFVSRRLMHRVLSECSKLETLRAPNFRMSRRNIENLQRNCQFIRRLELNSSCIVNCEKIIDLPLLESLSLSQPVRSTPSVNSLMRNLSTFCPNLNELIIPQVELPNEDLLFILEKMKSKLKILAIQTAEKINTEVFKLMSDCQELEDLRLQSNSLSCINMNRIMYLMNMPKLKKLSLKNYNLLFSKNYWNDYFFPYKLSFLKLIDCSLNRDFTWFMSKYMFEITSLVIDNCSDVLDADLPFLVKELSHLNNLHLANLDHITLVPFESCSSSLGCLQKLRIEHCPKVDEDLLFEWVRNCLLDIDIKPNSIISSDLENLFREIDTHDH